MRILTWNILHGGGRNRMPRLLMAMLDLKPDVVVVTEARRRFAGQLAAGLADGGLEYSLCPDAPDGVNTAMLVSRFELRPVERPGLPDCLAYRWVEATLPGLAMTIAGVHLAEAGRQPTHAEGWRALLRVARERRDESFVIAGDLNTWRDGLASRGRSGAQATNLGRLAALGYVDTGGMATVKATESTWTGSRGESFRLDYVVVSSALQERVAGVEVVHAERAEGLSDHAALVVELSPEH
jgi:endonuclease/exonuclease/phosphatase family metal-dependent hydrolase